jgi:predicted nucleic acid-binding protein
VTVSFDSNILVYALAERDADPQHGIAVDLVERACGGRPVVLVLQVLAELYSVATRKYRTASDDALGYIQDLRLVLPVHAAEAVDLDRAVAAEQKHALSFWDALLWATAQRVGVRHLLTEDFQDGRTLGGVTFVNPFEPRNQALIDRELPPITP